jgi:hypothetical protein
MGAVPETPSSSVLVLVLPRDSDGVGVLETLSEPLDSGSEGDLRSLGRPGRRKGGKYRET